MAAIAHDGVGSGRVVAIVDRTRLEKILGKLIPPLDHGMPIEIALRAAGLSATTYRRWRIWGKEVNERCEAKNLESPDESFSDAEKALWLFWSSIENAMVQALDRNLLTIQVASQNHWQAAAWWCERRFPEHFGRTHKVQHSGDDANPVAVKDVTPRVSKEDVLRKLSPSERATMLEAQRIMQRATQGDADTVDGESIEVDPQADL